MFTKLFALAALALIVGFILWPSGWRYLKTFYLIAQVSPYEQTVAGAPTILVLGDSTGYGTGATNSQDSIAGRIGQDFPQYSIQNNSVNGRTIDELSPVIAELEGKFALVLLQIGANDILGRRPIDEVEAELRALVASLSNHTEHLVMMSSGNVGGAAAFSDAEAAAYEALTREFRAMFQAVAASTPLTYVDLFQEPADDPFVTDPKTYLAIDGLHPSSVGYGLWYESLQPVLEAKLSVPDDAQ